MSYFSIFSILYMMAFLCEMAENWRHPWFALASLILICPLIVTKATRLKFFLFLVTSTAYVLLFRFPEVANHVNVILLINFSLIAGILYSWLRPTWTDDDYYRLMQPCLRLSMAIIYCFTGFHKLNRDFFHPQVSCIEEFFSQFVWLLEKSNVYLVPTVLILVGAIALLHIKLFGNPLKQLTRPVQILILAAVSLTSVVLGRLIGIGYDALPTRYLALIIVLVAAVVIIWEMVGGLMLLVPKTQGVMIAFSLAMHASFALIGFVDFSALAVAVLFTFVPIGYLKVLDDKAYITLAGIRFHRVYAYVGILLVSFFLAAVHYKVYPILGPKILTALFISGMFFNVAAVVFYWPILSMLCSRQRLPWEGVPLFTSTPTLSPSRLATNSLTTTKVFALFFAGIVFFWGFKPYLGLRTAGTFSMFSNLRTEGEVSNHLLLSSNPLKVWGYQEDVVEVLEIDDETARLGHKYRPLKGYILPTVEFRKLIYKWTKANYTVPITFVHGEQTYSTQDIVNDPTWKTPQRNWESYLMDFRIIQPGGANQCRW
ncbi:MAG: hypothetical protein AAFQ40_07225 [Cyanobacteria bacterium J06623_5]